MSSAPAVCHKCRSQLVDVKKGFKLSTGEYYHKRCFVCDRCRSSLAPPKVTKPRVVYTDSGEAQRICYGCQMKDPVWGPLLRGGPGLGGGVMASKGGPPPPPVSTLTCDVCRKMIMGSALKTSDGRTIHAECDDRRCAKCKLSLAGKSHGVIDGAKWCEACIRKRPTKKTIASSSATVSTKTVTLTEQLAGIRRMKTREERARAKGIKLCGGCHSEITGVLPHQIGKKYFHRACMKCAKCSKDIAPTSKSKLVLGPNLFCSRRCAR